MNHTLLGISVHTEEKSTILKKIRLNILSKNMFIHIVSLNPEILVTAQNNSRFANVLSNANIQIVDGVGIEWAASVLDIPIAKRVTGIDLMEYIVRKMQNSDVRILFIGGKPGVAKNIAVCYQNRYSGISCHGVETIQNIKKVITEKEKVHFLTELSHFKPHIIFASFGSPFQELFFWENRDVLKGIVCVGVGGAFDFVTGNVSRAPRLMQEAGLEWLYRLWKEPRRIRRQLKLPVFVFLVLKQYVRKIFGI